MKFIEGYIAYLEEYSKRAWVRKENLPNNIIDAVFDLKSNIQNKVNNQEKLIHAIGTFYFKNELAFKKSDPLVFGPGLTGFAKNLLTKAKIEQEDLQKAGIIKDIDVQKIGF